MRRKTGRFLVEGDLLKIITPKGATILADASDYDLLTPYSWCVSTQGYAVARINGKVIKMNRHILGLQVGDGIIVDHRNRNKLDNRRKNLRKCTRKENVRNISVSKSSRVGQLGVRLTKCGRYNVGIVADGIEHHIGNYGTLEEAVAARNAAEDLYHGDFGSHNSIGGGQST